MNFILVAQRCHDNLRWRLPITFQSTKCLLACNPSLSTIYCLALGSYMWCWIFLLMVSVYLSHLMMSWACVCRSIGLLRVEAQYPLFLCCCPVNLSTVLFNLASLLLQLDWWLFTHAAWMLTSISFFWILNSWSTSASVWFAIAMEKVFLPPKSLNFALRLCCHTVMCPSNAPIAGSVSAGFLSMSVEHPESQRVWYGTMSFDVPNHPPGGLPWLFQGCHWILWCTQCPCFLF